MTRATEGQQAVAATPKESRPETRKANPQLAKVIERIRQTLACSEARRANAAE